MVSAPLPMILEGAFSPKRRIRHDFEFAFEGLTVAGPSLTVMSALVMGFVDPLGDFWRPGMQEAMTFNIFDEQKPPGIGGDGHCEAAYQVRSS